MRPGGNAFLPPFLLPEIEGRRIGAGRFALSCTSEFSSRYENRCNFSLMSRAGSFSFRRRVTASARKTPTMTPQFCNFFLFPLVAGATSSPLPSLFKDCRDVVAFPLSERQLLRGERLGTLRGALFLFRIRGLLPFFFFPVWESLLVWF